MTAASSIAETRDAIDHALRERGAPFTNYSCKTVSWDDVSRGTIGGSLSCWGANITDTYLKARDGTELFTVRPDNWNERLGVVSASDVALLIGNCEEGGSSDDLRNVTLADFLRHPTKCGAQYTGMEGDVSLYDADGSDLKVSIRFQTVFLPVSSRNGSRQTLQFATEAYNYNTHSDDDPRNLVLLCTTQGLAVLADGAGTKRLYHHARDAITSRIQQYWLEAERSDHAVGGPQLETVTEREDALQRGKATARVLGLKAMGTRFNTLMTIQVPLQPRKLPVPAFGWSGGGLFGAKGGADMLMCGSFAPLSIADGAPVSETASHSTASHSTFGSDAPKETASHFFGASAPKVGHRRGPMLKSAVGESNAARVSRGVVQGLYVPLNVNKPKRNAAEHCTVTVVFYNTVAGGVPTPSDVLSAVEDMDNLLTKCSEQGRLADSAFNFMKKELTVKDVQDIMHNVATQPRGVMTNSEPAPAVSDSGQVGSGINAAVMAKVGDMCRAPTVASVLGAKMTVMGALADVSEDIRAMIGSEFDKAENIVQTKGSAHEEAKQAALLLKLIVTGVLDELTRRVGA